jgi:predicted MFS family arabinose efflux permease
MGQAVGAAMGGWMVSQGLIHQLHWLTAAFLLVAMAVNRKLRSVIQGSG